MMNNFGGMKVIVMPNTKKVKRSWFQRIFTFPWEPMTKYTYVKNNNTNEIYILDDKLFVSQDVYEKLKKGIDNVS